ncbi:MAG: histidine kinase dimerization/phospho-acceptor domain-containing protein, partial [Kiloniellales bacterium]|nr:histidine kinase dimerization/phospho-acceptor domain-containing protein [Kiloniellales bacterium]
MTPESKLHRLPLKRRGKNKLSDASSTRQSNPTLSEKGPAASRKSAQSDLRKHLERLLLDEGPPTCIINGHGDVLYANDAFESIKRSLAAEDALPSVSPGFAKIPKSESRDTLAIKTAKGMELYRTEQKFLSCDSEQAVAYIYRPLPTDAKAQQKIALLNTRLEDVTRLVSDLLWETDRNFNFTFVSTRVTDVLGFHPMEIVGQPMDALFYDLPPTLRRIVDSQERSPFRDLEVTISHKAGDLRTFRLSGLPVYEPMSGTFSGLRGTAEDVTALRTREEALLDAKEAAELANRAKTEFLANMSHELRTPLNAVIGFSEIMEQEILGPLGNEQYKSYVTDIHSSAEHLLKLINDILDIAKIEAGNQELSEEEFDPARVIDTVARLISERCFKGGLDLDVSCAEKLPKLYGDERKIKQVLLNLLSNASKFTPNGGKIRISARVIEDGSFIFEVSDNGIGIEPDHLVKAFA